MNILSNVSLRPLTTFHIDVTARFFAEVHTLDEAMEFIRHHYQSAKPVMILGGGSNVLFTKDYEGLVLKNSIGGIEMIREDDHHFYVKAGAGVNWHKFVMHCIDHNYAGIENLSLIPGNVGASPMQNIGAYGVEVREVIDRVEAIELYTGKILDFNNKECDFGYRSSIFKTELKDQLIITSVTYKLLKKPEFNTSYGAIREELDTMQVKELNLRAISDAVCNIRRSKLPDPNVIGNAGSFFKNPVISLNHLTALQATYADIPAYKVTDEEYKVAAGWLIEKCGWKGKRIGDYGVHTKQALVLVNYENATGAQIYRLSQDILDTVKSRFDIELEREVNII